MFDRHPLSHSFVVVNPKWKLRLKRSNRGMHAMVLIVAFLGLSAVCSGQSPSAMTA